MWLQAVLESQESFLSAQCFEKFIVSCQQHSVSPLMSFRGVGHCSSASTLTLIAFNSIRVKDFVAAGCAGVLRSTAAAARPALWIVNETALMSPPVSFRGAGHCSSASTLTLIIFDRIRIKDFVAAGCAGVSRELLVGAVF